LCGCHSARAQSSHKTHRVAASKYFIFCESFKLLSLPTSEAILQHSLSKSNFVKHVRMAVDQAGHSAKDYAGHSFRIGAATTTAVVGLEDSDNEKALPLNDIYKTGSQIPDIHLSTLA